MYVAVTAGRAKHPDGGLPQPSAVVGEGGRHRLEEALVPDSGATWVRIEVHRRSRDHWGSPRRRPLAIKATSPPTFAERMSSSWLSVLMVFPVAGPQLAGGYPVLPAGVGGDGSGDTAGGHVLGDPVVAPVPSLQGVSVEQVGELGGQSGSRSSSHKENQQATYPVSGRSKNEARPWSGVLAHYPGSLR